MSTDTNLNPNLAESIPNKFNELLRQVISMDFDSSLLSMMNNEKLYDYIQRIKQLKLDTDQLWSTIHLNNFPPPLRQSYVMPLIRLTANIERVSINLQIFYEKQQQQQQQQQKDKENHEQQQQQSPLLINHELNTTTRQSIVQFRSQSQPYRSGNSSHSLLADYTVTLWDLEQTMPTTPLIIEEERDTSTTITIVDENPIKFNVDTITTTSGGSNNSRIRNVDGDGDGDDDDEINIDDDDDGDENFSASICSTPYFHRRMNNNDDDDSNETETLSIYDTSSFNNSYHTFSTVTINDVDDDTFTGNDDENNSIQLMMASNNDRQECKQQQQQQTSSLANQSIDMMNTSKEQNQNNSELDSGIIKNSTQSPLLKNNNDDMAKCSTTSDAEIDHEQKYHIIERNERIQRKHFADIDYIRCIKLFIKNIRPNIDHLSNESFRMAKQYRLILFISLM
nr:transcription factor mef2A-like [Dermatophagoides farinae]